MSPAKQHKATLDLSKRINLASPVFQYNQFDWYQTIREQKPVCPARISIVNVTTLARYDDCTSIQKDPRFVRNRSTATGGSRFAFPLPKSIQPLAESMITSDDPDHRRLRSRLQAAFKPQAIAKLEQSIERYTTEKLDSLAKQKHFDIQEDFAKDIPIKMISDMIGLPTEKTQVFEAFTDSLSKGLSGIRMLKTVLFDLPKMRKFVDELLLYKRANPGDDILTELLANTETSDSNDDSTESDLTDNELVAMVFLLVVAGYETTVHLIGNSVITLLEHPQALEELRSDPRKISPAIEEVLRHRGPLQSSKPVYPCEDVEIRGEVIKKGTMVMPLYGSANHDPEQFDHPLEFDINRTPNRHLGFGHGAHFCLGAHLARAEARIAISGLIERFPNLSLAKPASGLELQNLPGWYRFKQVPVSV